MVVYRNLHTTNHIIINTFISTSILYQISYLIQTFHHSIIDHYIGMISEWPCDTEDWSNETIQLYYHRIHYIL